MLLAVATAVSCNKKETLTNNNQNDSVEMSAPSGSDTTMTGNSATTSASAEESASLSDQDKKFADAAAKGGMMEVMAGELAVKNTTNPTVKILGEMMVKDHTKANDELKQWATASAHTLPAKVDAAQQKKIRRIKS
ncbi:DUF4142 domain-containing protein [Chryseobacterium formosus]|uniref:DUF4142 domain-containing protein n=1 Tax=Chryseobacterium formosus TaxID=1537363 RepID=A0ABT3XXQ2_9FLAO|nr:DUF4142 domain-containing protein [Chryseobacterium formosus]MCX8526438.1 DUF4142 domain-containing protein [Chryseobacterium formosus]